MTETPTDSRSALARYGVALAAVGVAFAVTYAVQGLVNNRIPFAFFYAAVVVATFYGGLRPGLLAIAISAVLSDYFFLPPYNALTLDPVGLLQVVVFLFVSLLVCVMIERSRRAEAGRERLRESERAALAASVEARAQAAGILESITDGFLAFDRDWRFTYVNREGARTLGRRADELVGKNLWQEFPDLAETSFGQLYRRAAEENRQLELEDFYPPFDAWFHARAYPNESGLSVYFHDVTARRRADEMRAHLASIVESSDDVIIGKTLEGVIVSWNRAAERIYGYTSEEAVGRSVAILIPADRPDELQRIMARLRRGESIDHYVTERVTKDGRRIHVSLTISPIRNSADEIIGASTIARDITEIRQAAAEREQLLAREQESRASSEESELRYRSLVQATTQMVWSTDADGMVEDMPEWRAMTGQTLEEVRGRGWLDAIHPEDRARVAGVWDAALAARTLYNVEYRIRSAAGGYRHVSVRGVPIVGREGRLKEWIGTLTDDTDRKRAEAELRRAAAIVENSDDAIISKSLDGVILSWNPAARRLYGYTSEEAVGRSVTMLIPPDRPDEEPHILEQIRRGERVDHYETVRVRKDGQLLDVSLTVSPVRDAEGNIVGASKIARDITARRRAELELREQAEIIETVNRTGQMIAGELDVQNVIQSVTDASTELSGARFGSFFYNVLDERGASYMLYTLSGVPREAFAHFPMPRATDLFGPTFRGEGPICIDDVTKDARYGRNSPYYGMPEGHLPVTSYLAVPVVSRSGEVMGGLFFGHPEAGVFTERAARIIEGLAAQAAVAMDNARLYEAARRARDEAERSAGEKERLYRGAQEASRLKDEFLATVSHELRTPLTAILGWSHMLRTTGQFGDDTALKALETIERNARSQSQLIDDLLDVSRIITGKLRIDVRPVDPNSFIEAAVEAVRPAAEAKGVRVQRVMDTGVVTVSGDPVRLQQVVWNLLSNAVKFTPKEGRVQIRLERVNSHVEIAVSDTGAGIAEEFLPYVFDRFRQADQRTTRQHGGLGLGLAIVRQLVELHGGTVRAESAGEGRGSTFTVLLPVAPIYQSVGGEERVHPAARDTLPSYECPDRLDGLRVLAVDDEPDTREVLTAGLGQCGAKVTAVGSVAEALEAIASAVPDLLVSDIGMPGEDGYELIRRVRELPAEGGGKVPAIALTAYARVEDRMQALRAGYQMHVPKPVELAELVAVAASLVRRGG